MKRLVLGLEEIVYLQKPDGSELPCRAKIDTGARTSAIDISLAEALGFGATYQQWQKLMPPLQSQSFDAIKTELATVIAPRLRERIPGLADVQVVRAANGVSVRPYVTVTYRLRDRLITALVSIADRSHLSYSMLVGKSDLAGFLINPAKTEV